MNWDSVVEGIAAVVVYLAVAYFIGRFLEHRDEARDDDEK